MGQKVLENIPNQKQRGELLDSIVQNPEVLEFIREKKYTLAERLVSELIDKEIEELHIRKGI